MSNTPSLLKPEELDALLSIPLELHLSYNNLAELLAIPAHSTPTLLCPASLLMLGDLARRVHLPLLELLDDLLLSHLLLLLGLLQVPVQLLEDVRVRIVQLLQPL